uniref:Vpu protein n=1 Tax=Simian immunodeficiency virus TaxID=11723 RepID=J7FDN3_SIV|nr:vpu protein [Simian immunodeficiency virus]
MTQVGEYCFLAFAILLWIIAIIIIIKALEYGRSIKIKEVRAQRIIEVLSRRVSVDSAIIEDEEAGTYYLGNGFDNPVYTEGEEY